MAHNLPHSNIIIKVITTIDIPTNGSSFFPFGRSFSLWGFPAMTQDLPSVFGTVADFSCGSEGEDVDRVIDTIRMDLALTSGEPGWLVPLLIASIFRRKDSRFLLVPSFGFSA
jgi:hypothetical protein